MSKNTLTEIKKGQTGTGLLIENDGYISIKDKENKSLMESFKINESTGIREIPDPFIVSAVFQKFGIENANGRIYPEQILKREVEKYQQAIRERRAYGELNHPQESAIDLGRLAMNIIELHWEGRTLVGKIEIPITPGFRKFGIVSTCFDNVAHEILSGLKIGVSSRALGSVEQKMGSLYVGEDLELVCWDFVSQPSTPGAWVNENPDALQQYVESKTTEKQVVAENSEDKFSKFDSWLND